GKRSFVEEVAHLLNCEARFSEAVYLALIFKEPSITKVHPERQWGKLINYENFSPIELLNYFSFRRSMLHAVLQPLSEKDWLRIVREIHKQRQETVYLQVRKLLLHELHHLDLIEARVDKLVRKSKY
ncbi:MAG: DinB family protein, partial [Deinococcota bacterium]